MSEILDKMRGIQFESIEAAAQYYGLSVHVHPHNSTYESFKEGAQWQKEQLDQEKQELMEALKKISQYDIEAGHSHKENSLKANEIIVIIKTIAVVALKNISYAPIN